MQQQCDKGLTQQHQLQGEISSSDGGEVCPCGSSRSAHASHMAALGWAGGPCMWQDTRGLCSGGRGEIVLLTWKRGSA